MGVFVLLVVAIILSWFGLGLSLDCSDNCDSGDSAVFLAAVTVDHKHTLVTHNLPPSEIQALYSLYNATNGANWKWKTLGAHWVFTSTANPCTPPWQGVTCTTTLSGGYLHVSSITLTKFGLYGTIPDAIGALPDLVMLNLNNNRIYGTIPDTIGQLTALATLYLQSNAINGSIPSTIGTMTGLKYIYLDENKLTGPLPAALGALPSLSVIEAPNNAISGTLPTALCSAPALVTIMLNVNLINGSVPDCFRDMLTLQGLYIPENYLTGTIPSWLGALNTPRIQYLYLHNNYITGTMPALLGDLSSLLELEIYGNFLNGTIPHSLGNLSSLQYLYLGYNYLTGTIPDIFCSTPDMLILNLEDNQLTGTIPSSLGSCTQVFNLNLDYNHLEGPIPNSIGNLSLSQYILMRGNYLSGTLPSLFCNKTELFYFQLDFNRLSGTIADCLTNTSKIAEFSLGSNRLHGSIPASLFASSHLSQLDLDDNHLSGSIPHTMGAHSQRLKQLILNNNVLTGTVPAEVGFVASLQQLNMAYNHLTGQLPVVLSASLTVLIVNNNYLTGSLPACLGTLTSLQSLLLNNNQLSGTLENIFNTTTQHQLQSVAINNNQLTGTIPVYLFNLPYMNSFVASTNCFHGTLPAEICSAPYLTSLVLDGLSSASSCRHRLLPAATSTYTIVRSIHGQIPSCLFSTPYLRTLQLSGNKLSGSLADTVSSALLTDLSLSHNALTGSIPTAFQKRAWNSLDLSYNKFSGTLQDDTFVNLTTTPYQTLHLVNNRLSGCIPASIQGLVNISILGTNMFSCRLDESDLPTHDQGSDNYQCGSREFDIPYYLWLALMFVAVCVALVCITRVYRSPLYECCIVWYAEVCKHIDCGTVHMKHVSVSLDLICRASASAALYALLVLLPLYAALSSSSGTTTFQYAWTVSAAYLAGKSVVIAEIVLWFTLLGAVLWMYHRYAVQLPPKPFSMTTSTFSREMLICSAYLLVNTIVVVAANVAYVYVAIYQSSGLLVFMQIALAFFKFIWSNISVDFVLTAIVGRLRPVTTEPAQFAATKYTMLALTASIINSVVIPCLVVATISPNCFYNVFAPSDEVKSAYVYYACGAYLERQCLYFYIPAVGTSTYSPPFEYNFQCSTSLITYYSPAYVNLCIVSTFLSPVAQFVAQYVHQRATRGTLWFKCMNTFLPPIWKPLPVDAACKTYFKPNKLFVNLITYLTLILTFGVMFPPLGVALAISVCVGAYFAKLKVGRFLTIALQEQRLAQFLTVLERECEMVNAPAVLQRSLWVVITLSCWFYTIFLFDTLGDAVGIAGAYWVLIVVPLLPVCMYCVKEGYSAFTAKKDKRTTSVAGVEMETKGNSLDVGTELSTVDVYGDASVSSATSASVVNVMHAERV